MDIEQVKKILNDPGNCIKRRYQSGLNSYDVYELDVDKAAIQICQLFPVLDLKRLLKWEWQHADFWLDKVMVIVTTPFFAIGWAFSCLPGMSWIRGKK